MAFGLAIAVAAASGFVALSYEILWYRVISFASWGLPGAFGLLLASYLLGLAAGARVAAAFCKANAASGDRTHLRTVAAFVLVANVAAWLVVPAFGASAQRWEWPPALAAVVVAAALLGAVLPLVSHFGIAPDDRAGARLSWVYLANICGSATGSLVTGFVLLDAMSLEKAAIVVASIGMLLVLALAVASGGGGVRRGAFVLGVTAVALVAFFATPRLYDRTWERLLYKSRFDEETTRFAEVIETKSGVIAVTKEGIVYGGGAYDGKINTSLRHDVNGIQRAYGIGAMHPAPQEVLMIGLASGSWAKVVSSMPGVSRLVVVEINPGYLTLIGRHPEVSSLLSDPKVTIAIDDGRRWLLRSEDRFDVIVMNTTYYWRAHSTNLLSAEFMEIVRARMKPGGILYFNATGSPEAEKTALTSFPYGLRVHNFIAVSDEPIVFDKERFERVLTEFRLDGEPVVDTTTTSGRDLMQHMLAWADTISSPPSEDGLEPRTSILRRTESARIITDDNMATEWQKVFRFHQAY